MFPVFNLEPYFYTWFLPSRFRRAHASPLAPPKTLNTTLTRAPLPFSLGFSLRQRFLRLHELILPAVGIDRTMASSDATGAPTTPLPGNCLVIGGNRGLGLEIVRHLKERQSNVMATTRKTNQDLEVMIPSLPCADCATRCWVLCFFVLVYVNQLQQQCLMEGCSRWVGWVPVIWIK